MKAEATLGTIKICTKQKCVFKIQISSRWILTFECKKYYYIIEKGDFEMVGIKVGATCRDKIEAPV